MSERASFSIVVHAANRPARLRVFLESLEKNSNGHHQIVIVLDHGGTLPVHPLHSFETKSMREYVERWLGFRGEHIEVEVVPFASAALAPRWGVEHVPNWFYAWAESINFGVRFASQEWLLMGCQDDNYFAPEWDACLAKWINTDAQWLAPVTVFGFPITSPLRQYGVDEAREVHAAYWHYFDRWNTQTNVYETIVDRDAASLAHRMIRESAFCRWLDESGVRKPNQTIVEIGGPRRLAGECPTLFRTAQFREIGGYPLQDYNQHVMTALTVALEWRLGAMGLSKLAVQDSVTLNTYHDIELDVVETPWTNYLD